MSVVATVFHPDGTQIRHLRKTRKGPVPGKPLVFEREDAPRAFLSARRAWWPTDRIGKKASGPEWGNPPIGAEIRLNGQPWLRWEDADVEDENGEIIDVRGQWIDIAQRTRDEVKAKKIAAAKAAQAARRAAALAEQVGPNTEAPPVIAPVAEDAIRAADTFPPPLAVEELEGGRVEVGAVTRTVAAVPAAPEPKPRKIR